MQPLTPDDEIIGFVAAGIAAERRSDQDGENHNRRDCNGRSAPRERKPFA